MNGAPKGPSRVNYWDTRGRSIVFMLAASSIACLLADFYGLCPMRLFTPFIFLPALVLLLAFAILDRLRGNRKLWRAVWIGLVAGLQHPADDSLRIRDGRSPRRVWDRPGAFRALAGDA